MAIYRRFRVQQKYVNGKPTEEYRLGAEIDSTDYNSLEECNRGSDCTELEYRWVDMESADDYICEGTNKYKKQRKQQKCITEEAWTNVYPYEYQKGELIEQNSIDCGYGSGKYHIYGTTNGYGSINISPSKEYYSSTDIVTITALPSTDYIFSCYNYGGNMTYGSVAYNSVLSLTMSHNWYVSAAFVYGASSVGSLFYLYSDDTHSWYDWSKSTLSGDDNTGWKASVIIDYSGVIQTISKTAFDNHAYLTEIVLPNCSYIGSYGFHSCYSLTSIDLPNCLSVDIGAFGDCSALTYINLPNCSYISNSAIRDCRSLKSINLPNCSYVGSHAFGYCETLISISLPLCEYVGYGAFEDCYSLTSINLPNCSYVTSQAFMDCSLLKTIRLPKVTYFEKAAFEYTSIQNLYMDQITSVPSGRDPFSGYLGYLKSIFIPCSLLNDFTINSIWSKYSSYYVCASENKEILTATDGGGTVTLNPEGGIYTSGTTVNIGYKEKYGYEFNHFQYGSTSAYGSTVLSENFSLVMNQNWYVSAAFSKSASLGTLYYSYWNSTESWYVWALSRFTKYNNNGSNADTIIDYSGVIKTLPTSAFRFCSYLTTISLPNCSYIGSDAFFSTALVSVSLPKCSYVGYAAFEKCRGLKNIDLPLCSYIGKYAFFSCSKLASISLQNCTFISEYAFKDCYALTSVNLPLCSYIGWSAFENCTNLSTVSLPKVTYISGGAFTNTRIETLYMNQITSVPSGGDPFVNSFSYLKSIIIPCSLINDFTINSIWSKYSSYYVCDGEESNLKEIFTATDGGGVITLDPEGGKYYSGTTVNIGYSANPGYVFSYFQYGSTPAYGSTVLNESFSLLMSQNWYVSVNFDYGTASSGSLYYSYNTGSESWYDWSKSTLSKNDNNGDGASIIIDYGSIVQTIPSKAFSSHSYLTKIVLPNCTYIGDSAFEDCSVLSSISLPNCSYVGSWAFYSCYSLTSINLPLCSYVGNGAFTHCSSLTSIYLPLCQFIGYGAFIYCSLLTSVDLPSCSYVGSQAFYSCYALTSVNLPLCSYVGSYTFNSCSNLTSINLPNCTYVSYGAFDYCKKLTSIDLPLCSYVGSYAFYNCQKLTSINFPLCEFIGGSAFAHCSNLTSINFQNCSLISYFGFGYCESLTSISLPNCTYVSDYAFTHCSLLTSINLPLCSYVCRYAFEYCRSLTSVNLPKVTYFGSHVFESAPIETLYMNQITSVPSGYDPSINRSYIKSIFIPCSLVDAFTTNSIWSKYSSYFVCV